jgi:hypothetical protein
VGRPTGLDEANQHGIERVRDTVREGRLSGWCASGPERGRHERELEEWGQEDGLGPSDPRG